MAQAEMQLPHKLTLNDRKSLKISGVTAVEGFDAETVLLQNKAIAATEINSTIFFIVIFCNFIYIASSGTIYRGY